MKKRLRLIIVAFSISFLIMAALSLYSLNQFNALTNYSDQVDHTNHVISKLYQIESLIKELDIQEREAVLTKDSSVVAEILQQTGKVQPRIEDLRLLTQSNEIQKNIFVMLKSAIAMRIGYLKDNLIYNDTARSNALSPYYYEGRKKSIESIGYIRQMLERESEFLVTRSENKQYYQQIASNTLKYLMLIFGIVTIILFLLMINEFKIRLAYQDELQTKLIDLKRSHAELEQIAFAASHDLQEPLRKIRIFSNRLLWLKKEQDKESKDTIDRITYAAGRMQELIDDMVNLTSLIKEEGEKEPVDLNHTLKMVIDDLDDKINSTKAVIHREVLPEINGYSRQFHILFKSLLDNSLKFRRDDVTPVIAIRADKTAGDELMHINKNLAQKKFHRITISDNGIGFDNKFISKMFQIFQRLHNQQSEYEGKGIGLAICQRIMVNHEGYIVAHGHPEAGATFKLFFPVEE